MSDSDTTTTFPLLADGPGIDTPLAWRYGQPIARAQYLRDVAALAATLPEGGPVLAMTGDRYRFALALGAALVRGQAGLMPPNHTPDMVERLRRLFPQAYVLADDEAPAIGLPVVRLVESAGSVAGVGSRVRGNDGSVRVPRIAGDHEAAQVLTSGSTGAPMPHGKRWDLLNTNLCAEAARLAEALGRTDLQGVTLVGTVPAHHMYGFESTVLLALLGGAAFAAERPFFPGDIVQTLASVPRPRVLVTTPFHLKTLVESGLALPPVDLTLSATAPLSPQLAARAEAALGGPLVEIYGCTEAGQVATRRTTDGPEWRTFDGLMLSGDGEQVVVRGGHVPVPTPLADVLEVLSPTRFRLLGRSNDLINVAGKRSSLAHLNHHLNSIAGVQDGAFWLPPDTGDESVVRLVALVVAPELTREALLAALRQRVDAAFLPRQVLRVESLPRDGTGKLPAARLAALAEALLASQGRSGG
ncbi:AMP-binding protein [Sphaerotilus sp.]|uniref:AMP-binding protein n=1 Tax=Sphaerotilus sp. TaxID=2093942 RepID=UPI00286E0235|nr:AMP-binding protein [Sphaerotilus sp.]